MVVVLLLNMMVSAFFAGAAAAQSQQHDLGYDWDVGVANTYDLNYVEKVGTVERKTTGEIAYKITQANVTKGFDGESLSEDQSESSTSTAFLVNREGYLLTCEHCVKNAESIFVTIGGERCEAKVVETDRFRDLAIIKIDASKVKKTWQPVRFGVERPVDLAQDVRAIGFPLSSFLGSSVKVVQGSIAGFIGDNQNNYKTASSYQIDAAVNPGNSGGPLVDNTSAVVGIVNAKLSSAMIDKVGFAIPSRLAVEFMKKNNIGFFESKTNDVLSGPELAKRVTPAVAFVEVTPNSKLSDNFMVLVTGEITRGGFDTKLRARIIINNDGAILDQERSSQFKAMLTPVASLPFVEFPNIRKSKWKSHRYFVQEKPRKNRATKTFGGFRHFGGMGQFGQWREESEAEIQVYEVEQDFQLQQSSTSGNPQVQLTSKTRPLEDSSDTNLSQDSDSLWTFDPQTGFPTVLTSSGKLTLERNVGVNEEFSFDFEMKLVGTVKDKVDVAGVATNNAKSGIDVFSDVPSESPDQLTVTQLAEFTGPHADLGLGTRMKYLNRLTRWKSAESANAVVEKLVLLTKDNNKSIRKLSIDALVLWSPDAATEAIINELDLAVPFSKRTWILKLAKTNSSKAADKLCDLWDAPRLRKTVEKALKSLGSIAEPAVVRQISSCIESVEKGQKLDADTDAKLVAMISLLGSDVSDKTEQLLRELEGSTEMSAAAREALSDILDWQ